MTNNNNKKVAYQVHIPNMNIKSLIILNLNVYIINNNYGSLMKFVNAIN